VASFVAAELIARLSADVTRFTSGMSRASDTARRTSQALEETTQDVRTLDRVAADAGSDIARNLGRVDQADDDLRRLGRSLDALERDLLDVETGRFEREMDAAGDAAKRAERRISSASRASGGMSTAFVSTGKAIGVGIAAAAAGAAFFGKSAIDAATESYKMSRQTEAVIRATGGAANVTAAQVDKFADALGNKIGVDDEAIKKSMNILLTFKQVRNETGKGNDIFNRATRSMMDLANIFGSSDAAAKMLGKALSDPIKGVTALQRAGVNFSASQREQIKTLVESGQTLEAQKLILAEVESQVGGTAEATATAGDRLKKTFGDFQETVGEKLRLAFEKVAGFLVEKFIPAATDLYNTVMPELRKAFEKARETLAPLARELADRLGPAIEKVGKFARENKEVVATFFGVLAAGGVIAAVVALAAALAALFNPVTLVIVGIAALAAAIVYAYNNFERFREIVDMVGAYLRDAWPGIQGFLVDAMNAFAETVGTVINTVVEQWRRYGDDILKILAGAFDLIRGLVNTFMGLFTGDWSRMFNGLGQITQGAANLIYGIFGGLYEMLRYATSGIFGFIGGVIRGTLNGIASGFERLVNLVIDGTNRLIEGFNDLPFLPNIDRIPRLNIPRLADGGVVTRPTTALIGEAGPEAVIPLRDFGSPGLGGTTINVNVSVPPTVDQHRVGQAVVDALVAWSRRNGAVPVRVA
jgi:hypothetical protein